MDKQIKPGDEIICINDKPSNNVTMSKFQHWVQEGVIYVCRKSEPSIHGGERRILVEEIKNKPTFSTELRGMVEPGYSSARFRRVEDLTIDEKIELIYNKKGSN